MNHDGQSLDKVALVGVQETTLAGLPNGRMATALADASDYRVQKVDFRV